MEHIATTPYALQHDPFSLMVADHQETRQLFRQWDAAAGNNTLVQWDSGRINGFVRQLVGKLSQHKSLKEQLIHELYTAVLGPEEGGAFYRTSLQSDITEKLELQRLELATTAAPDVQELQRLMDVVKASTLESFDREENVYWPRLEEAMSAEAKRQLYADLIVWRRTPGLLPTHPHPESSSDVMGSKLTHPMMAAIDRAVDTEYGQPNVALTQHQHLAGGEGVSGVSAPSLTERGLEQPQSQGWKEGPMSSSTVNPAPASSAEGERTY
jgi:hypothetical protein